MIDFERIPTWLRWVLFLPSFLLTAIIVYFVGNSWITHWLSDFTSEIFVYIVTRFIFNLLGIFFCVLVSVSMIPKGRVILSSIYLSIFLVLYTFTVSSYILIGPGEYAIWQIVLEAVLSIISCIYVLWLAIDWKKKLENTNQASI